MKNVIGDSKTYTCIFSSIDPFRKITNYKVLEEIVYIQTQNVLEYMHAFCF